MEKKNISISKNFLSARQAARKLGCAQDYIGKLCREGKLDGRQVGRAWVVSLASVKRFELERAQSKLARTQELAELRKQESRSILRVAGPGSKAGILVLCSVLTLGIGLAAAKSVSVGSGIVSQSQSAALGQVDSPFFGTGAHSLRIAEGAQRFFGQWLGSLFAPRVATSPAQNPASSSPQVINNTTNNVTNNTTNNYTTNNNQTTSYVTTGGDTAYVHGLDAKLNDLRKEVYGALGSAGSPPSSGGSINNIALSQIIDKLNGVTISNSTVNGLSGLTDADIPDAITVSNYLPLAGGTLTGGLVGTTATFDSATTTNFAVTGTTTLSLLASCTLKTDTNGIVTCGTDLQGSGGGSDSNWTYFNGSGIKLATTSNQVIVGSTSTTTSYAFQIVGGAVVDALYVGGSATSTVRGDGTASTFPYASSTALSVSGTGYFGTASTSNLTVSSIQTFQNLFSGGLAVNTSGQVYKAATTTFSTGLTYTSGNTTCDSANGSTFGCLASADWSLFNNKISSSSLSQIFPFTPTTNYGALANSTSTPIWFTAGLQASSTSQIAYASSTALSVSGTGYFGTASSTNLFISSIASGSILKATTGGQVTAATAGTDYVTGAGLSAAYPFALTGNATSTLTQFNGGLTASTILATGSTTLQDFTALNSTSTNATTTTLYSTTASSTNLFAQTGTLGSLSGAGLSTCNSSTQKLLWTGGIFSCGTDLNTGGGSDASWTFFNGSGIQLATTSNQVLIGATATSSAVVPLAAFNVIGGAGFDNATTTTLFSTTASSTNLFTSNLSIASLSGLLKATNGLVSVATAGTDYATLATVAAAFPFTPRRTMAQSPIPPPPPFGLLPACTRPPPLKSRTLPPPHSRSPAPATLAPPPPATLRSLCSPQRSSPPTVAVSGRPLPYPLP